MNRKDNLNLSQFLGGNNLKTKSSVINNPYDKPYDKPIGQDYYQKPYSNQNSFPQGKNNDTIKSPQKRTGMSNNVWERTLGITEALMDIIKAVMVVGGILAANLADLIFGAIGITILFGGSSALFLGTPVWMIGGILSMGASAIQIFLWSLIQKRGITFSRILKWKTLPEETKVFLGMAIVVWCLDTMIDMSPIALLVQNSQYETIQPVYWAVVFAVSILVFILCGFSEIMTSNMRAMLMGDSQRKNGS